MGSNTIQFDSGLIRIRNSNTSEVERCELTTGIRPLCPLSHQLKRNSQTHQRSTLSECKQTCSFFKRDILLHCVCCLEFTTSPHKQALWLGSRARHHWGLRLPPARSPASPSAPPPRRVSLDLATIGYRHHWLSPRSIAPARSEGVSSLAAMPQRNAFHQYCQVSPSPPQGATAPLRRGSTQGSRQTLQVEVVAFAIGSV
jgi:hypothetical protein